jgi:hypothetical protein
MPPGELRPIVASVLEQVARNPGAAGRPDRKLLLFLGKVPLFEVRMQIRPAQVIGSL